MRRPWKARAATGPGTAPAQAPSIGQLLTLAGLIAISSVTLLPLWREATDHVFANLPDIQSASPGVIEVLRWFALAIRRGAGLDPGCGRLVALGLDWPGAIQNGGPALMEEVASRNPGAVRAIAANWSRVVFD